MADASLLKLDMSRLIDRQEALVHGHKKRIKWCLVVCAIILALGVEGSVDRYLISALGVVVVTLGALSALTLRKTQMDLDQNREALRQVYEGSDLTTTTHSKSAMKK